MTSTDNPLTAETPQSVIPPFAKAQAVTSLDERIQKSSHHVSGLSTQEYFVNMGPQHPSTHGVLRLVLRLDGETVQDIMPVIGYVHRGIEKKSEAIGYRQQVHLTDRLD